MYVCLCQVLAVARRIFCCGTQDLSLWHAGCSLRRTGSVVVVCGLSCPTAYGILVPRPGIELTSPALEGGFSTIGPPGKSL